MSRSENITKSRCGSILNFGSSGCYNQKNNNFNTSRGKDVESIQISRKTNNTMKQENGTETSIVMHRNLSLNSIEISIIVSVTVIVLLAAVILVVVLIVRKPQKEKRNIPYYRHNRYIIMMHVHLKIFVKRFLRQNISDSFIMIHCHRKI